jgi:phasin family protein
MLLCGMAFEKAACCPLECVDGAAQQVHARHPSPPLEEMTMLTVDQVVAAQKTQLGTAFGASATVFEGVEKIVRLNMQAARATLDEFTEATRAVLNVTHPQQLLALSSAAVEPTTAKWTGYAGQVYAIVAATGAQLRALAEQTAAEAQGNLVSAVEEAMKNAPSGSEGATAFVKQAFTTANNAFENMQSTVRQMTDAADAQVETISQRSNGRKRAA